MGSDQSHHGANHAGISELEPVQYNKEDLKVIVKSNSETLK